MCKMFGIDGFKTNHSLRVTTATRLFHAGVEEQLIMKRTGHRSLDGVWLFKRPSSEQEHAISDILNNSEITTKRQKTEEQDTKNSKPSNDNLACSSGLNFTNCNVKVEIIHKN